MTNFEKIKAMSVEEMAKLFYSSTNCCNDRGIAIESEDFDYAKNCCFECPFFNTKNCDKLGFIEWLESEVEENMLPELCSCGYRFEADETICPNCGKKVEEDGRT